MKRFVCDCGTTQSLFFESSRCLSCQRLSGYCDKENAMLSFDETKESGVFMSRGSRYQQCKNYRHHQVCNGMIRLANEVQPNGEALCFACHFNSNVPDLDVPEHLPLWRKLETAKRRLLFTLQSLGLPIRDREQEPEAGLSFSFMADKTAGDHFNSPLADQEPVFTGHANGNITINLAEADDVARHAARVAMGEGYRTLLGHFRHEIGHYYWDVLIARHPVLLGEYRKVFGDERESYQDALDRHYKRSNDDDSWKGEFISRYASMHPWEDWAETWAHYLHMLDTLETAQAYGIVTEVENAAVIDTKEITLPQEERYYGKNSSIEDIVSNWIYFSVVLNALNRSMGLPDAYPFVISDAIRAKLAFVHRTIHSVG